MVTGLPSPEHPCHGGKRRLLISRRGLFDKPFPTTNTSCVIEFNDTWFNDTQPRLEGHPYISDYQLTTVISNPPGSLICGGRGWYENALLVNNV